MVNLTSLLAHSYTANVMLVYSRRGLVSVGALGLLFWVAVGCSAKKVQYPEDHQRYLRIDQAVESLRQAYVKKETSGIKALMLPKEPLEWVVREAESDFESFQEIAMEFRIERIMIEADDIDVYVHWQGLWKKDSDDPGFRQRGHSRLQWVGTNDIFLRAIQGDVPFGAKARQAPAISTDAPLFNPLFKK